AGIRAERRAGELLRETGERKERRGRGGDQKSMSTRVDIDRPTLKKLGVSLDQSSDWQKLAAIPQPEFERRLAAAARSDPPTHHRFSPASARAISSSVTQSAP